MLCEPSNQIKSKTPSLHCKEIYCLSNDNNTVMIINTKVKSKYKCFDLKRNKGYANFDSLV